MTGTGSVTVEIRALMVAAGDDKLASDLQVLDRLLEREHEAHKAFGDSAGLFGVYDADEEEEQVAKGLAAGVDADEIVRRRRRPISICSA